MGTIFNTLWDSNPQIKAPLLTMYSLTMFIVVIYIKGMKLGTTGISVDG
jgi:hypothetical protein